MMVTVPVMAARRAKLKPAMPLPMTRKLETRSITLLLAPRPANRLTGEGRSHRITNYDLFPHIFNHIPDRLSNGTLGGYLPVRRRRGRRAFHQPATRRTVCALPPGGRPGPPGGAGFRLSGLA